MSKKYDKEGNYRGTWLGRWYWRFAKVFMVGGCLVVLFYIGLWIYTVYLLGEEFDFF